MSETKKKKYGIVSIVITLIVIAVAIFLAMNFLGSGVNEDGPPTEEEIAIVLEAAAAHLDLPDEEPTVGRIKDVQTLVSQQGFYEGAENGDYLLIYPQTGKAIIFSLDRDILVNVGPVIFQREGEQPTEVFIDEPIDVEVRNGSGIPGAAGDLADTLNPQAFDVVGLGNAGSEDFEQTTIVVLDDQIGVEIITVLADQLGAAVSAELPLGEDESQAQMVIIVGGAQASDAEQADAPEDSSEESVE